MKERGGTLLPIGPFRAWLLDLIAHEEDDHVWEQSNPRNHGETELSARRRVAAKLGVTDELLRKWLKGRDWVFEKSVDAACCMEGTHMSEIYPEWYWNREAA